MSGGHFDYNQYRIGDIADEIAEIIANNDSTEKDRWGDDIGYHFDDAIITKFKEALGILRKAEIMAQRIDWLLSGDDGEESFHRRWKEDLSAIKGENT